VNRSARRYGFAGVLTIVIVVGAIVFSSVRDDGDRDPPSIATSTAGSASTPSTTSTPTTIATTSAAATHAPRGNGKSVTFAFAGDVNFPAVWDTEDGPPPAAPPLAERVRADPHHVLDAIAPVLSDADLSMVNVETAITDGGEPVAGKNYHFRSPAETFDALTAAGVDVVNMANNHALDYGVAGLQDTFAAISASKLAVTGLGHDAGEAYRPYRATIKGQRIAILSATDWLEPALVPAWSATDAQPGIAFSIDDTRLLDEVREVRPDVDTLVVFLHWGTEETWCASGEQQDLATALLGAGADVIVGSHAHRVFGAGKVGPALVAYGLGNFVFYNGSGKTAESGVLTLTFGARQVTKSVWTPAVVQAGQPIPLAGAEADQARTRWEALRECTGLAAQV